MTHSRIAGLLFLALSLFYAYATTDIPSLPIDEFEAMTARSLPFFLSGLGVVLSLVMILTPARDRSDGEPPEKLSRGDWHTVLLLLAAVLGYSLALDWLGFLVTTVIFLAAGFVILGERRWPVVAGVSLALVGGLWLILVPGLDIYLAPGRLLQQAFG